MDFSQIGFNKINVEFKDLQTGLNSQRYHAKVVLIDKTGSNSQQCYVLKNESSFDENDIENFKKGFHDFVQEDFLLIGEVLNIDKVSKSVVLKDKNSISYDHLIIASGSHYSLLSYEFLAGVQTLVDAIRVRKKIPSAFAEGIKPFPTQSQPGKKKMKSSKTNKNDLNFPKKIENLQSKKINRSQESANSLSHTKRLYEVQI